MIDLHVHSTFSDGTFTPTELVDYATAKGLTAFALTDHDTVAGLEEALTYREELVLRTYGLVPQVIPGIELSTDFNGKEVHIVGLYIDYKKPEFVHYLEQFVASRNMRNQKMCELLTQAGMPVSYAELEESAPGSIITRAHFARILMENGYTKSIKEGFERYVGDHCPYYVPREKVDPRQAIRLILGAGGIPILAHPILYRLSEPALESLVKELTEAGLAGIEAVYSTYTRREENQIRTLATKYNLLLSGGSDFHGKNKPGLDLASGYGKLSVPDSFLEQF